MRLSEQDQATIRETAREVFGDGAQVIVFGSRARDDLRGGDIDLLVQLPCADPEAHRKELTFGARLQMRLGDQPIDIITLDPETETKPIHREALRTGVAL